MTDLELLRAAARTLGGKEKTAYDPLGMRTSAGVVGKAISGAAGRSGYEALTEAAPRAIGGALGPVARVGALAAGAAAAPVVAPAVLAAKGVGAGARAVGARIGREALHLARANPVGTALAAGFTYALPPQLFRPAEQVRGFTDDLARVAHGLPSSPVQWG